eukprot:CAMPEP_0119407206 /NCGR_PEP_ID=MMETSP1335-20130426/1200_1 /TAXON_ID=259385 /ORGANISM="Chrysoculter rhomboideus, Strain RCC1486" /LENGTH=121 /DNA_ID=CAMNT_0007431301 /DNA_START=301 /DNA_END=663 /DNA_ORIENTATION=-
MFESHMPSMDSRPVAGGGCSRAMLNSAVQLAEQGRVLGLGGSSCVGTLRSPESLSDDSTRKKSADTVAMVITDEIMPVAMPGPKPEALSTTTEVGMDSPTHDSTHVCVQSTGASAILVLVT